MTPATEAIVPAGGRWAARLETGDVLRITDLQGKQAIYELTDAAGFPRTHVAFITAYQDRQSAGFKKTVAALAWGSFTWFVSEPENVIHMRNGAAITVKLRGCARRVR